MVIIYIRESFVDFDDLQICCRDQHSEQHFSIHVIDFGYRDIRKNIFDTQCNI